MFLLEGSGVMIREGFWSFFWGGRAGWSWLVEFGCDGGKMVGLCCFHSLSFF